MIYSTKAPLKQNKNIPEKKTQLFTLSANGKYFK